MTASEAKEKKLRFVQDLAACVRSLPARSQILVIAHAAYESGWGCTPQAKVWNLFNLTAGKSWKGPIMSGGDLEYTPGNPVAKKIVQEWRCYPALTNAVNDYLKLLEYPRYLPARAALLDGDAARFVEYLGPDRASEKPPIGNFYTLPTTKYLRGYSAVLAEVTALIDDPTKE